MKKYYAFKLWEGKGIVMIKLKKKKAKKSKSATDFAMAAVARVSKAERDEIQGYLENRGLNMESHDNETRETIEVTFHFTHEMKFWSCEIVNESTRLKLELAWVRSSRVRVHVCANERCSRHRSPSEKSNVQSESTRASWSGVRNCNF
uniref:Uncharacterized protein n=1 Tax=Trichogramma kaykai TaxID=54128 RepID=A0ABD2VV25_9HYME